MGSSAQSAQIRSPSGAGIGTNALRGGEDGTGPPDPVAASASLASSASSAYSSVVADSSSSGREDQAEVVEVVAIPAVRPASGANVGGGEARHKHGGADK